VHSLLETFWAMGQDIVLQEYVRESKGRDLRVIVVGGKVVAAMRRVAKPGEFRANLHRGGKGDGLRLPRAFRSIAIRAAKAMGLEVAGVDMLEAKTGPKILEINSSPGLEGIERATGVDVAGALVAYAEQYAGTHRRISQRVVEARLLGVIQDERMPRRITRPPPADLARTGRRAGAHGGPEGGARGTPRAASMREDGAGRGSARARRAAS
jgi:ribosomal protein S6--L-glutamate ligase